MNWKHRQTVPESEAFDFVMRLVKQGEDSFSHPVKDGMVTIEWGWSSGETSQQTARGSSITGDSGT